jgi:hypothetical protein
MSEDTIIIFDTDVGMEEIPTKNEIVLFYEGLKKTGEFSIQQIDLMHSLETDSGIKDLIETTIDTIILEQIMPYVIPILQEIPDIDIKSHSINRFEVNDSLAKEKRMHEKSVDALNIIIKLKESKKCLYKKPPRGGFL